MARQLWETLSPAYRGRLERGGITRTAYESGVSLAKARGHAATPEHPREAEKEKNRERYRRYRDKKAELAKKVQGVKERWFGNRESWNPVNSEKALKNKGTRELQRVYDLISEYEDFDDFLADGNEIDESLYYH